MKRISVLLAIGVAIAPVVWAQTSVKTAGDIETDAQLKSNLLTGTPPLAVSSTTNVPNLNADLLDGQDILFFAFYSELLDAIAALDDPDPPCFSNSHRFADCGNGTVTDSATGLSFLKDADCFPAQDHAAANATAAGLFDGSQNDPFGGDCGLSDGSRRGDWRLLTNAEVDLIIDSTCPVAPKLVGNATGVLDVGCYSDNPWADSVLSTDYWGSAGDTIVPGLAWVMDLATGGRVGYNKNSARGVWPVRAAR